MNLGISWDPQRSIWRTLWGNVNIVDKPRESPVFDLQLDWRRSYQQTGGGGEREGGREVHVTCDSPSVCLSKCRVAGTSNDPLQWILPPIETDWDGEVLQRSGGWHKSHEITSQRITLNRPTTLCVGELIKRLAEKRTKANPPISHQSPVDESSWLLLVISDLAEQHMSTYARCHQCEYGHLLRGAEGILQIVEMTRSPVTSTLRQFMGLMNKFDLRVNWI